MRNSSSNKIDIMEFTMRATHFLIRINTAAASLLLNANHVRILDAFFFFTPQFTDYVSFAKDSHIHKIYLIHHGCVCAFLFDLRFGKNVNFCYLLIFIVYIIFWFFVRVDSHKKKSFYCEMACVWTKNKFARRLNPANELKRNDKKRHNKNEWCIKSALPSPPLLLLLLPLKISFTCSQFIHSMYA